MTKAILDVLPRQMLEGIGEKDEEKLFFNRFFDKAERFDEGNTGRIVEANARRYWQKR